MENHEQMIFALVLLAAAAVEKAQDLRLFPSCN